MKQSNFPIGFQTNIFYWEGLHDLEAICDFAVEAGFNAVEIGPTVALEESTVRTIRDRKLAISDLIYCRNLLGADSQAAQGHRREVERRIEFAAEHEIPIVTISAGFDDRGEGETYDSYEAIRPLPERSLEPFLSVYGPLIDQAENRGVNLAIENCPIMGNWAISPYLWERLFEHVGSSRLGLTYDPCHLAWQFIDPYEPLSRFKERIFHFHAKDVEIDGDRLKDRGILTDFTWWKTRIPGWGMINWRRMLEQLQRIDYRGVISIEHEDPLFRGSIEKVKRGLREGLKYLRATQRLLDNV
jgi:sugar phosphate isomerase/epimerase